MFDDVHTSGARTDLSNSLLTDDDKTYSKQIHARRAQPAATAGVVVGLRPNLRQHGVSAHGGDRRGQWNHARTIPNNLEWHIDIGRSFGLRRRRDDA